MDLSIHIQSPNINTDNADLYVEINVQGLSYIILSGEVCVSFVVYNFEAGISNETTAANIHQVIANHPELLEKFNRVHIIYGYASSVLVPQEFMSDSDHAGMLELVYGDIGESITRTDFIQRHSIHNIYGVPAAIDLVMTRYFASAAYIHLFSVWPDIVKDPGTHLYCVFGTRLLKVLLIKEGRLQVMQTYFYSTPEDVAYRLLHLCNCFNVPVNESIVHLSGMIETNAALYNELYKYFLLLRLETLPQQFQYPEELNKYPPHYFSHLFSIASCV